MKIISLLLFVFAAVLHSSYSFATEEHYITCHDCSTEARTDLVSSWGLANLTDSDAEIGMPKELHVFDYTNGKVDSFLVFKRATQAWGQWVFTIQQVPIDTPAEYQQEVERLKQQTDELLQASSELVIPESVIANPWEFIGCQYCTPAVQEFYNNSLEGKQSQWSQTVNDLSATFGFTNSYTVTVTLKFADGGQVTFETALVSNTYQLRITKILSVTDEAHNEVPLDPNDARNKAIRVINEVHGNTINSFLEAWRLAVPPNATGRVIIRECARLEQSVCF